MDKIIEYMILEDEGFGDVTSNAVIDKDQVAVAEITSKEDGILAGVNLAKDIFDYMDIEVIFNLDEGSRITKGDLLFYIKGNASDILLAERTVLNLLMHMSGVATFANTHRFSLDDMILIKDNHIKAVGTPLETLKKAQKNASFSKKIEIEVESLDDAVACVKNNADIVMLDNMSPDEVKEVLDALENLNIRQNSLIEVSGGITKDNICDYATLGVDIISVGALTHSSRSLNFSLNFADE